MKDRIPTPGQEGRVLITPEGAGAPYYAIVRQADNPIEPGTALNKANLLSDSTVVALRLDPADNPTPNDAFAALSEAGRQIDIELAPSGWQAVDVEQYPEFADHAGEVMNFWPPLSEPPLPLISEYTSADMKITYDAQKRGLPSPSEMFTVDGRAVFFLSVAIDVPLPLTLRLFNGIAHGGL